jgi:transposase
VRLFHPSAYRVHVWQQRFGSAGREGLADRSRGGRPPKLAAEDRAFVEEALDRGPQAYGLPTLVWTLRDLQALLQCERGIAVSVVTLHRVVHALGLVSRRPRHDLTHRQDLAAVAAATQVLDWLQKKLGRQSWLSNEALFEGGEVADRIAAEARLEPAGVMPRRHLLAQHGPALDVARAQLGRAKGVELGSHSGDHPHGATDHQGR